MRTAFKKTIFAILPVLTVLLLLLAGPAARNASAQEEPERVSIGSDMLIAEDEVVQGDLSVTNGDLVVRGEVQGDVTVVNGSADVEGKVSGNVAVTRGKIFLGAESEVGGNVVAFMGELVRSPGARVAGTVSDMHNPFDGAFGSVRGTGTLNGPPAFIRDSIGRFGGIFGWGLLSLMLLVLSALLVAVMPHRLRIAADTLQAEVVPSGLVGAIAAIVLPIAVGVISLALVVTIVGSVLVPVVMFATALMLLFGLTVVSLWMGRHMYASVQQGSGERAPLLLQVLLGVPVVLICTVVPAALLPGWAALLMLPLLYFAACVGLGAAILSRFGTLAPRSARPLTPGRPGGQETTAL